MLAIESTDPATQSTSGAPGPRSRRPAGQDTSPGTSACVPARCPAARTALAWVSNGEVVSSAGGRGSGVPCMLCHRGSAPLTARAVSTAPYRHTASPRTSSPGVAHCDNHTRASKSVSTPGVCTASRAGGEDRAQAVESRPGALAVDYSSSARSVGSLSSLLPNSSTLTSLNVSTRTDFTNRSER